MKGFTTCLLFLAAGSHAMPQYSPQPQPQSGRRPNINGGGGVRPGGEFNNLPDGCRIEYQTVHSIEEVEREDNVCTPYIDNVCSTVTRRQCDPYQEDVCKLTPQQKCETKYEEVCSNLWRDVPETYTEDECNTYNVNTCQKHWKTYPNGDKKWEDDPSTCQELPETKCAPVQKTRVKPEQYRKCDQVPRQNCWTDEVEECYPVTKQRCRNVPEQVCRDVEAEKCEIVHTKTPQSKATQKAIRVCNNNIGGSNNSGFEQDFELVDNIDVKSAPKGEDFENDEASEESKEDGSRIGFIFSE